MNYETALKLKKAGFPQDNSEFYFGQGYRIGEEVIYEKHHKSELLPLRTWIEFVAAPTLSELIAACMSAVKIKERWWIDLAGNKDDQRWVANIRQNGFLEFQGAGPTPELAVAELWLQLNTK